VETRTVCGIPMGGEAGAAPSLLAGSIFFDRQRLVIDPLAGCFDRAEARRLIDFQSRWSEITGNPCCIDVIASTPEAMRNYLDFITEVFPGPLMIDGTSGEAKIAGIRYLAEKGLSPRVIYNSISLESTPAEFEAIGECGVTTVVVLLVESTDFSADGKIRMMTEKGGLIDRLMDRGVTDFLIDPGIIDLPSMGVAKEVMEKARQLGHLPGAAAHNAISTWGGLKSKIGKEFRKPATAVVNALTIAWGGTFVIYGPMALADSVFPAVAMVDAAMGQLCLEKGSCPEMSHPLFRLA
jgi:tetrahydromethanopterin S-methyltransferase subunit H